MNFNKPFFGISIAFLRDSMRDVLKNACGLPVDAKVVQIDLSGRRVIKSEHFLRPVRVVKVRGHEVAQAVGGKMSNPRPRAEVAHEQFDFVACAGVCRSRLGIRENIRFSTCPLPVQLFQQLVQGFRHRNLARLTVAASPLAGPERHRPVGEVNVFPCHVTDF